MVFFYLALYENLRDIKYSFKEKLYTAIENFIDTKDTFKEKIRPRRGTLNPALHRNARSEYRLESRSHIIIDGRLYVQVRSAAAEVSSSDNFFSGIPANRAATTNTTEYLNDLLGNLLEYDGVTLCEGRTLETTI